MDLNLDVYIHTVCMGFIVIVQSLFLTLEPFSSLSFFLKKGQIGLDGKVYKYITIITVI